MRVLFFNENTADYVSDGVFHGLRQLLGDDCVDVPRHDCMYRPLDPGIKTQLRGHGFTLYGLLDDLPALRGRRYNWNWNIHEFDLAVVANIWTQWPLVWRLATQFKLPIAVIDGADYPQLFPYSKSFVRTPWAYATPLGRCRYFKRELFDSAAAFNLERLLPRAVAMRIKAPERVHAISCSIPEEKLRAPDVSRKSKRFPRHIVDEEVARTLGGAETGYAFTDEQAYFDDLSSARFGITTRRAGWDALRHYEIAAAGTVPCFRRLSEKPPRCAPHGLDASNCIEYRDAADLELKLGRLDDAGYAALLEGAHRWVRTQTTRGVAERFLDHALG